MRGKKPNRGPGDALEAMTGQAAAALLQSKTKFELLGLEQVDKTVAPSSKCGRIYLPLGWVGKRVKIIRLD